LGELLRVRVSVIGIARLARQFVGTLGDLMLNVAYCAWWWITIRCTRQWTRFNTWSCRCSQQLTKTGRHWAAYVLLQKSTERKWNSCVVNSWWRLWTTGWWGAASQSVRCCCLSEATAADDDDIN
jgi:hypothetical protein